MVWGSIFCKGKYAETLGGCNYHDKLRILLIRLIFIPQALNSRTVKQKKLRLGPKLLV